MSEGLYKSKGGLIRAFVKLEEGSFSRVVFSGDFILSPERYLVGMESCLRGVAPEKDMILSALEDFFKSNSFQSPGAGPKDFTNALLKAIENGKA